MAVSVEVALLSGRSAHLRCEPGSSVEQLQLAAERELGVCVEHLITAEGALLRAEDSVVWEEGARLTARVRAPRLLGGQTAFALVKSDGSMVTWGLGQVKSLQATLRAFAAILSDGSVMTWGGASDGGISQHVQQYLHDVRSIQEVEQIQASEAAFAAIKKDGSVVTWGRHDFGGISFPVRHQLQGEPGVRHIQASGRAFAALRKDGSVVTWGVKHFGGDSSAVKEQLHDVEQIQDPVCGGPLESLENPTPLPPNPKPKTQILNPKP
ncbi:unnamed protein product [Symbiodinium natans]|uniref:Ubiquitin-like domain-containing protein n=1 Tax=Symbiodinium natans TaxID=878477 RepID=A0A812NKW7_9DINO|nr:unnamed protein product [Symbiodinium natans]